MIHIAGPAITCGSHRRQRCSWCGTIIEDQELANIMVQVVEGEEPRGLPEWPFEALIDIDGTNPRITSVVEAELHEDGSVKIPHGSCMSLPVEVTI